jgi:nucleoside-diphosphate-sugar epimerase
VKIVITGGCGFLGMRLARRLLERGELTSPGGRPERIDRIVLADASVPDTLPDWADDRIALSRGDISDPVWTASLVDRDDASVFHLASVVSAQAEADPELALRVNIDGARSILAAAKRRAGPIRLVATSTFAAFGGDLPACCSDETKLTPQTTYGMTKVILELLINDASRRGEVDGRIARLATVIVRPGVPNAAASSLASSILREPLAGRDYEVPAAPGTRMAVTGVRTVIEGLIALHEADVRELGVDRAVSFPSEPFTLRAMADELARVAGDRPLGTISWKPDPRIEAMVLTWPDRVDASRATALGVPQADSLERIIRDAAADIAAAAATR